MSSVATAVVGGAVVGGIINSNASRRAAQTQADASNNATQIQKDMFDIQRSDQQPWREAGQQALGQLTSNMGELNRSFSMGDFQKDPGYQFRMDEGQKALERSAAARGGLQSGATMKAISRYGQDYAANEFQNAYNRFNNDKTNRFNQLATVAGIGQTANNQVGQAGQNFANNASNNMMSAANAQSAAQMAQANNLSNIAGQGANAWMQYQMMNKFFPTAG